MQCQRLSPAQAYARLLAMRRQPCDFAEAVNFPGAPAPPEQDTAETAVPPGTGYVTVAQRQPGAPPAGDGYVGIPASGAPTRQPAGGIPLTMSVEGRPGVPEGRPGTPGGQPQSPADVDEGRIKTAVQNFRNILTDIERQQSQQRGQLERLAYKSRAPRTNPQAQERPPQQPQAQEGPPQQPETQERPPQQPEAQERPPPQQPQVN